MNFQPAEYEYGVLRCHKDGGTELWRGPWLDGDGDEGGLAIAQSWVDDIEKDGARKGAFVAARRRITHWEVIDGN